MTDRNGDPLAPPCAAGTNPPPRDSVETDSRLARDLAPAEAPPAPFHGLSFAEIDTKRFFDAGLDESAQESILGLTAAINHVIYNLKKAADFLPPDLSIDLMRKNLILVCCRMRRVFYCSDSVGVLLCDVEDGLNHVRDGLVDLNLRLKARAIENPSIAESIADMDEGLTLASDHLSELDDIMS